MQSLNTVQFIAVAAIPFLFAITIHEIAHGWVARKLGDPTATMLGRLSLNPLKHIDPIGTVTLPLLMLLLRTGWFFGWAKPVPVTAENFKNPKRDMALVAAAGPLSNFMMAIFWAVIVKFGTLIFSISGSLGWFLFNAGLFGVYFNLLLMIFNLFPIPPLDGGRVISGFLPGPWAWQLNRVEPFGIFIVLGLLLFTGMFQWGIQPLILAIQNMLFTLFGIK